MPPEPRPSFRVSYRVSLVVVVSAIVALTGVAIAGYELASSDRAIRRLADDKFADVTDQAVAAATRRVLDAVPAIETARRLMAGGLVALATDPLARALTAFLRANPGFSWVSFSDTAGGFTGAFHSATGEYRVNQSAIHDGHTEMSEHDVDEAGGWTLRRHELDDYDPRTRPFYRLAVAAHARAWTPPYVFFEEGVPGITCAEPLYDAAGGLEGVLTVDFDLNSLSRFLARLVLSPHGQVFLFAPDGTVIAHPTLRLVESQGHGAAGHLVKLGELTDPAMRAYVAALRSRGLLRPDLGPTVETRFGFEVGGTAYQASFSSFDIDRRLAGPAADPARPGLRWVVGAFAPLADFTGAVDHARRVSLAISAAMLAFALLLAFVLAGRIAAPLLRISGEIDRAGRLDLAERPAAPTLFREIARMNDALGRMKAGLRSFGRYVNGDLVREMIASGHEARLEGSLRECTMFFSDIAGFTSFAERVEPDALVEVLGEYFAAMMYVLAAHGGTFDKFIGDAIMAFWNAPTPRADHAALACEAALRCQRRLRELCEAQVPWATRLTTRIGLATGEVLVGNIGTPEHMNYTVIGDAVNLASRLEGLNKQYGTSILVSESTYRAARDRVVGRPIDLTAVKGKARPIRVYTLLALAADAEAPAAREIERLCEDGLDRYLGRDFAAARDRFREVIARLPGDQAAAILLERCEGYLRLAPPESWTGVHVATEK